jgi:glutamyl-Q tRNA(Asp) synthetase
MIVTRFAPSPTGLLHLGHAHSALFAHRAAQEAGGRFLLRIEDIDAGRSRPEFVAAIEDDLAWLGLDWERPVRRQSEHMADYRRALDRLAAMELIYPCFCTRAEIQAEIADAGGAPHGPDGPVYPGTCRDLTEAARAARIAAGASHALRLDIARAVARAGPLAWHDRARGTIVARPEAFGDVVLARKDVPASYHLAVTVDDALQGVTRVTRGEDLVPATDIHRLLQALLGLPVPEYHHHALILDAQGRRFAKRDRAATLRDLRAAGRSPAEVRALAGFPAGTRPANPSRGGAKPA